MRNGFRTLCRLLESVFKKHWQDSLYLEHITVMRGNSCQGYFFL
uniref:Uncharacterized protein n=1 Tax=Caudovirales sp. ctUL28 TaxID=2826778 RepID=A0A8S5MVW2_9CAUD|nr:MAG TPA: hypothetical protein [Caudovirales sp. ctUL28]